MLERTFIHCPTIGPTRERAIWSAGASNWSEYMECCEGLGLSAATRGMLTPCVAESIRRLHDGDGEWFASKLPARDHWRALSAFQDDICYLDIETTGCDATDRTTVVGLATRAGLQQYVLGENLRDFMEPIRESRILVTFFGSGFDLPFLRREFGITFPQLHVDLCHLLKRLGYRGGLKSVERQLGLARSETTEGIDGFEAVELWHRWAQRNDAAAREILLEYNAADVLNMRPLLEFAHNAMLERTFAADAG